MAAWLYIMTNRPKQRPLHRCHHRHRGASVAASNRRLSDFTKKYGLTHLVYVEAHETIDAAIRRERTLKTSRRAWKVRLTTETNLEWRDLYDDLLKQRLRARHHPQSSWSCPLVQDWVRP
jgi:putative endonuclease